MLEAIAKQVGLILSSNNAPALLALVAIVGFSVVALALVVVREAIRKEKQ